MIPLADARADGSGRFRIDAPRTSSTRHEEFGAVAMAPGYGIGWVGLDPDDDQPTAEISLRPEQVIHGRLFDVQGRPVPDVTVSVRSIRSDLPRARASLHDRYIRRRSDGVYFWSRDAHDYPAWPRPVTTDAEGRFTVRGVGQKLHADLTVHHPRFALQSIDVDTDDNAESKTLPAALAPSQIVNVRVTYADTGEPVPHSPLRVGASRGRVVNWSMNPRQTTQGRPASIPGRRTAPTVSRPIPRKGSRISLPVGGSIGPRAPLEQTLNIALPRGVLVHGKVTEEGTGKPVAGAQVVFATHGGPGGQGLTMSVRTNSDGSFRLGAKPEAGHLFVRGPDDDYVFQVIGSRVVQEGQPGGWRIYAHSFTALDLKPGDGSQEVNPVLRAARPWLDGCSARMVNPSVMPGSSARSSSIRCRDPRLAGLAAITASCTTAGSRSAGSPPMPRSPFISSSQQRKLGAVVNLSVKSAAGRAGHRPARALRVCPGADRRPRRQAGRETNAGPDRHDDLTPGPARNNFPNNKATTVLSADEGRLGRSRPDELRDGSGPGHRGPDHAPRLDPRCDVPLHGLHHVRPRPDRPRDPQGIHRQAGREANPGRYPNRTRASVTGLCPTPRR